MYGEKQNPSYVFESRALTHTYARSQTHIHALTHTHPRTHKYIYYTFVHNILT